LIPDIQVKFSRGGCAGAKWGGGNEPRSKLSNGMARQHRGQIIGVRPQREKKLKNLTKVISKTCALTPNEQRLCGGRDERQLIGPQISL